jgi:hypothetical protein
MNQAIFRHFGSDAGLCGTRNAFPLLRIFMGGSVVLLPNPTF